MDKPIILTTSHTQNPPTHTTTPTATPTPTTTTTTAAATFLDENNNNINNNTPSIYLILENPRKTCNWGPVLRCAAAFAVTQVIWVGYATCNTEGSHGAASHVSQIAFPVLSQAIAYVRGELSSSSSSSTSLLTSSEFDTSNDNDDNHPMTTTSVSHTTQILGIICRGGGGASHQSPHPVILDSSNPTHCFVNVSEIDPTTNTDFPPSYPVRHHPIFSSSHSNIRSLAIILSKDALGLPFPLASVCDTFVHIPHVPLDDRIFWPLDLPSCLSIVLHRLRQWAPYPERNSRGHKFHVETHRSVLPYQQPRSHSCQRPLEDEDILDSELLGNFFSLDVDDQGDDI